LLLRQKIIDIQNSLFYTLKKQNAITSSTGQRQTLANAPSALMAKMLPDRFEANFK
jgi:hypothetical protein